MSRTDDQPADLHPDIAAALAAIPGGVVVDARHAVWPELDMSVDVPADDDKAVGSCATGNVCAFSGTGLSGTRVSWSTCGTYAPGITVRSIANARSAGYAQARTSAGAVLATAIAGSSANVSGSVADVRCVS
ncbi:peptidase inhibitor family I36 protein [Microbacterium sp. KSW4-17]|uniref:Peptidase inhibitor family I36 protein n=1 Tax=Microbacterium galbum TaxID=3075994 RepID=A0ABU3T917_9MICO|nr:peptidase inhibitor family I36 protein [Microbacterium sp. KSW4-17]MDU0367867.1 peptidase inhibitor family I36 protein [Microbacterium sp. KSW4-17]